MNTGGTQVTAPPAGQVARSAVATHTPPASSIARRAVELSLDGRVSLDDGAQHLCHLVHQEHAPLGEALRHLSSDPDAGPEEECARLLLRHALALLTPSGDASDRSSS